MTYEAYQAGYEAGLEKIAGSISKRPYRKFVKDISVMYNVPYEKRDSIIKEMCARDAASSTTNNLAAITTLLGVTDAPKYKSRFTPDKDDFESDLFKRFARHNQDDWSRVRRGKRLFERLKAVK